MKQFIGCDSHKKYSVFVAMNEFGEVGEADLSSGRRTQSD